MSTYKLPSNLDTDEKLVGFLSLKQFLFVLAGCGISFIAYTIAKVNILIAIPFVPFMVVFFVLGLYQRQDQPVEVYLAAWLKFKFGSKKRIWNQEGYKQHVIVTAPKKEDIDYTKGYGEQEIFNKFHGLSGTLDTRGWSSKGVLDQNSSSPLDPRFSERLVTLKDVGTARAKFNSAAGISTPTLNQTSLVSPDSFVDSQPQYLTNTEPAKLKVPVGQEVDLGSGSHEFNLR